MKSFLLKIILTGLTLGSLPQGAFAMEKNGNSNTAQNNNMHKVKVIAALAAISLCAALGTLYINANKPDNILQIDRHQLINPTLNPTYAQESEIVSHIPYSLCPRGCCDFFNSKKYGKVVRINNELQDLDVSSDNITILQLASEQQDGPNCAKYAFSNLLAIEQLHKKGNAITSANIAQEIKLPLKAIGFPGLYEWKPLEIMLPFYEAEEDEQLNWIKNYAKVFFPHDNMHLALIEHIYLSEVAEREIKQLIDQITKDLTTHGTSHILLCTKSHAVAISLIKDKEDHYSIVYMDSNNIGLPERKEYDISWCPHHVGGLITNALIASLKDAIEHKPLNKDGWKL